MLTVSLWANTFLTTHLWSQLLNLVPTVKSKNVYFKIGFFNPNIV